MAIGANIAAFSTYSFVIVGVFMYILRWWYVPEIYDINTPLQAHLMLTIIYTALHMLYFFLLYKVFRINLSKALYAVLISSLMATGVSYYYLRLTVGIIFIP